jgi:hypothetical protein
MSFVKKYEKYLFWLLVFLHLYPVLVIKLFPTLDGPAHLYNSNLINQLLTDSEGFISQFFTLKSFPVPNFTGHAMLCVFNAILPAWLSEKLLLVLIIILLLFSFRMLIKSFDNSNLFADYLIFPFIYSYTFYLGFFNFTIGLILMFFTLTYWIRNSEETSGKKSVILMLFLLLLYFSHLLTFLFTGFIIGLLIIWNHILDTSSKPSIEAKTKIIIKQILLLLAASIPGLVLTILFFLQKGKEGKLSYLEIAELFSWLTVIRPLITLNYENMEPVTRLIFYSISGLFLYIVISRLQSYFKWKNTSDKNLFYNFHDIWLLICIAFLVMYFVFPDWMSSGGHISMRLLLFFFIFLLIWIGMQKINNMIMTLTVVIFLFVSTKFLIYHAEQSKYLGRDALEIYNTSRYIEGNSTVLPIINSGNWMHSNFSNYLAAEKNNLIVLDNYEADKAHFALMWKENKSPYGIIAPNYGSTIHPCIDPANYERKSGENIDYILRWQYDPASGDSCDMISNSIILERYDLIYTSPGGKAELFLRKPEFF